MRALRTVQAQGPRDGVEDLRRHVLAVALLQPGVVRHRHPGQLRQLLAAQAGDAAVAPVVGQAHVLGAQAGPPGTQELAELGSLIKLVHYPSIPARGRRPGASS